jgi:PhnB protein
MATETRPYIFLYGRCAEALAFYSSVFGGSADIMRVKDTPADVQAMMPPNSGDLVMHAAFNADGVSFYASDGAQSKDVDTEAGNVSIGLNFDDGGRGERTIAALAEGGNLQMPLGPAFWGGRFANVVDKFGTEWMITLP